MDSKNKKERPALWTVGKLRARLAQFNDDWEIDPSGLDIYRVEQYGPALVQIEFNQAVYRNDQGDVVVHNPE